MSGPHRCDVEDVKQRLIVVFDEFKMKNKTHILLAYNYEYVFSTFNFMLLFSLTLFDNYDYVIAATILSSFMSILLKI